MARVHHEDVSETMTGQKSNRQVVRAPLMHLLHLSRIIFLHFILPSAPVCFAFHLSGLHVMVFHVFLQPELFNPLSFFMLLSLSALR